VLEATWWGFVGGIALVLGAIAGLAFHVSRRVIGLVMAFGAGVLISALTFELTVDALRAGGRDATVAGLAIGSLVFFGGNTVLDRMGGKDRKRSDGRQVDTAGAGLVLGAVLDGIPESIAIGLTLLGGASVSFALVGAVFLSNLPEAIGVAAALLAGRIPLRTVLLRFGAIVGVGFLAGLVGYAVLEPTNADAIAVIQSIAAGAMVVVVVNEMVPIAVRGAGRHAGLAAAAGFAVAAFLSTINP
jgi:zinc transporter, ZIP family